MEPFVHLVYMLMRIVRLHKLFHLFKQKVINPRSDTRSVNRVQLVLWYGAKPAPNPIKTTPKPIRTFKRSEWSCLWENRKPDTRLHPTRNPNGPPNAQAYVEGTFYNE
ncbi:hypothetical protein YC2023_004821 [Brassica napus]